MDSNYQKVRIVSQQAEKIQPKNRFEPSSNITTFWISRASTCPLLGVSIVHMFIHFLSWPLDFRKCHDLETQDKQPKPLQMGMDDFNVQSFSFDGSKTKKENRPYNKGTRPGLTSGGQSHFLLPIVVEQLEIKKLYALRCFH